WGSFSCWHLLRVIFRSLPIPRRTIETIDKATLVSLHMKRLSTKTSTLTSAIQDRGSALVQFLGKDGVDLPQRRFCRFKSLAAHDPVAEWLSGNLKVRSGMLFQNLL